MPLEVNIYPRQRLIWVTGHDLVTDDDLLDYVKTYLVEADMRTFDEVFDLQAADLLDVTFEGLSKVAATAAPTDPEESPTKIGILVSETMGVGISRMYQTLRSNKGGKRNLRIFWERLELLEWLERSHDDVGPPT